MTITKTALPHLAKAGQLGAITTLNRVLMAATTRSRAIGTVPNDTMTKFYPQRAGPIGAGLIITKDILIYPQGTVWPHAPGLWNEEQAAGWKKVVDAVHAKGTPIVVQLWHKKAGTPVYGPSAIAARGGLHSKLVANCGIEAEEAARLVSSGKAEAVTFARNFVNNPDYFRRVEEGLPANREMNDMLLQGGKGSDLNEGYTDYPFAE